MRPKKPRHKRRPGRAQIELLCAQIGPEDGIDPRHVRSLRSLIAVADAMERHDRGARYRMALIALFSMGVAGMLRSSVASISILIPFFLIVTNLLNAFEATREYGQYLPTAAGSKIMQFVPNAMGSAESPYGPWGGLGIMLLWVAASVIGGYVVLSKRDA